MAAYTVSYKTLHLSRKNEDREKFFAGEDPVVSYIEDDQEFGPFEAQNKEEAEELFRSKVRNSSHRIREIKSIDRLKKDEAEALTAG